LSEDSGRSYLPWVIAGLVVVVGGAKVDSARPLVARALAIAAPIVPVAIAMTRVEGASPRLERAAGVVGWLTILAGEACVALGFFHVAELAPLALPLQVTLGVACVAALVIGVLDARSGGKSRFGAYVAIAAVFAGWLSSHTQRDPFASVFGAFFVGFLGGGGVALLLGELGARLLKKA
jgi:hypothetical protein